MFSGCPSVRPSVRPKPELPSFDLYMGLLVHTTNRNRFTACPSVRPSVQRGFRAFARERMEGMAWNFSCWCILTIFRTDKFMATVIFLILRYFDLVKQVKFGVSGHFLENAWRKWPEMLLADVSWLQKWLVLGHGLLIFVILALFWLSESERVKFGVSGHFLENAGREWLQILHADVSWPPSELISSGSRSVDFCNFGTILT